MLLSIIIWGMLVRRGINDCVKQSERGSNSVCCHFNHYGMRKYKQAAPAYRISLTIYEQMGLVTDAKKSSLGLSRCLEWIIGITGSID